MAVAIIVATAVVLAVLVVVLARQGSVGRLSEEDRPGGRRPHVTGRPAGPGAERMSPDPPGTSGLPGPAGSPPDREGPR